MTVVAQLIPFFAICLVVLALCLSQNKPKHLIHEHQQFQPKE